MTPADSDRTAPSAAAEPAHELAAAKQQVSRLHDELRDMQHKREVSGLKLLVLRP
jgi:Flp pilus assembly CpaE family ATPase